MREPFDSSVDHVLDDIQGQLGFDEAGSDGDALKDIAESLRPPPIAAPLPPPPRDLAAVSARGEALIDAFADDRTPPPEDDDGPLIVSSRPPPSKTEELIESYVSERPPPLDDSEPPKTILSQPPAQADDLVAKYLDDIDDDAGKEVADLPSSIGQALVASRAAEVVADAEEDLADAAPGSVPPPLPSNWGKLEAPPPASQEAPRSKPAPPPARKPSRRKSRRRKKKKSRGMVYAVLGAVGVGAAVGYALLKSQGAETGDAANTTAQPTAAAAPTTTAAMSTTAVVTTIKPDASAAPSAAPSASASADVELAEVTLILDVSPRNAYVMFAQKGVPGDKRFAGPWPRHLKLEPGEYQLVIFRAGFKTVQRIMKLEPDQDTSALRVQLKADDIYND